MSKQQKQRPPFDPTLARPRGQGSMLGHYWREYAITPESDPGAGEYELLLSECLEYRVCTCRGWRRWGSCRHTAAGEAIELLRLERHYCAMGDESLYLADRKAAWRAIAGHLSRAELLAYTAIGIAIERRMNESEAA